MFSWVTNIIREVKELKFLAYHDPLTNLLNRNWLYKHVKNINFKYVYFIDINDLRKINRKGHSLGDEYIKMIVSEIIVEKDEILLRYAGDEFILFSNEPNRLETNQFFSVGCSIVEDSIMLAINVADKKMIENKNNFKKFNI